jgi:SAM-dependent methyltransferase
MPSITLHDAETSSLESRPRCIPISDHVGAPQAWHGPTPSKPYLHLGCGRQIREQHFNVDAAGLPGVDAVVDLECFPWPFPDNAWERVVAHHVLEHVTDFVRAISEVHRILAPGGVADIRVPHVAGWAAWNNPTHRHYFTRETPRYFARDHHYHYAFDFGFSRVTCRANFALGRAARLNWLMNPLVNTKLFYMVLWKIIPCAEIRAIMVK